MKNFDLNHANLYNKVLKFFLYFGIALFPLYIFGSGTMQISHFSLLIFSFFVLTIIGIPLNKYFYIFGFFLFYAIVVNIFYIYYDFYFVIDLNNRHLKDLLFLTYNFILTTSLLSYFSYQKKFEVILYGLITSILIVLLSWFYHFFMGMNNFRFTGFFNNPNQLGYFSVCCFSFLYMFYRNSHIPFKLMIILSVILIFFSILSLSKAAYIPIILCFIFALKPFNYKYSKIVWIIFLLISVLLFTLFFQQISETIFYKRILNLPYESDSSLEVRGYYVYFKANFLQAIFGMGPKNVYYNNNFYEIHSTFAMILSSFGLFGFLIFSLLMFFWILDINKAYGLFGLICVCAPTLLYGLTHNGIRFSIFWIFFALSIFMSKQYIKQKALKDI